MIIGQSSSSPSKLRQYLERYVNDGSPSGFSRLFRTSSLTDPYSLEPWFHLHCCRAPQGWVYTEGRIENAGAIGLESDSILLHPDLASDSILQTPELKIHEEESFRVVPTASGRTVQIASSENTDYLKLHFAGILGRVRRELPFSKAIAGIDVSEELELAISEGRLPERFAYLPETGARFLTVPGRQEIGLISRPNRLVGSANTTERIAHVWPLFSLFSTDRLSPLDDPVIVQLLRQYGSPQDTLIAKFFLPMVDCYFQLVSKCGYQVECNAENIMIGLDEHYDVVGIIVRDLMRFEKDLPIRRHLGLPTKFRSGTYKCIDARDDHYTIRHSFAFDFKFTFYLIKPLLEVVSEYFDVDEKVVIEAIKERVHCYLAELPENYFPPNGAWYKHDKVLLTEERLYVECSDPMLR